MATLATSVIGDVSDTIKTYPLTTDSVIFGHEFNFAADPSINRLFEGNKEWISNVKSRDPGYFQKFSKDKDPKILWIGCSDSREAVESITGTNPGDIFVYRNLGNIFFEDDTNLLSVLDWAINQLNISHIVVAAHTHCGVIKAALDRKPLGLVDNWLRRPQTVYTNFRNTLDPLYPTFRQGVVSIFNAHQSVHNIVLTSLIQKAWARGQKIAVHAWLFDVDTGYIYDTKFSVTGPQDLDPRTLWQV